MEPNTVNNTIVTIPVSYGSISFALGKKGDEYNTHQWTLFVRSPNGSPLSHAIEKVVFGLHPSFPQPVRTLTEPPYQITESGWGEFEANIRIFFRNDQNQDPIDIIHLIKLYPQDSTTSVGSTKVPVVSEFYDECVIVDPSEEYYRTLINEANLPSDNDISADILPFLTIYDENEEMNKLQQIHDQVLTEIEVTKNKVHALELEITSVQEEIENLKNP